MNGHVQQLIDDGRADILIVDDRPDKLLVYRTILEDLGQELFTAESGEQALKQVLERDFAVILLDVNMPGLGGLETAELIRKRRRSSHVPIIFVTADYNDEAHKALGYSLGAVDYIASPVVPEVLRAKVKVFVNLYLLAKQAERSVEQRVALAEEKAARAAAERTSRQLSFLAQASVALAESLDFDTIARVFIKLCVPTLGERCLLTLTGKTSDDARSHLTWPDDAKRRDIFSPEPNEITRRWLQQAVDRVLQSGREELYPSVADAMRASGADAATADPGARALAIVPLTARGSTLGALSLAFSESGRTFDADTLAMAIKLAGRAAIALDNARLYEKLQEEDRRKNDFLAMLAHELRNPLAPISNVVHFLNAADPDPAKIGWAREVICRQVKQLVRLVDDLLDIARITRGKIDLKIETIDVARVVAAAVETSRPLVDAAQHELTVSLPSSPLQIKGDFARVSQVLANIINNAAKYTEKGGRIAVTVTREGGEAFFRVRDSGVGIPREMLSSIFEPFTQVHNTLDRAQGGLGIGLTLSKRLLEMQGGSVSAFSEGLGRGSEFIVRMPVSIPAQVLEVISPETSPRLTGVLLGLNVLIVDDNHDVAESTAFLLRSAGCTVHLAYDGEEAVRSAKALHPDAVLLDIGLPKMDGYQVAARIREESENHKTLIVGLSGYGQDEHREQAMRAGFDCHVVKPIDPLVLTSLLAARCWRELEPSGADAGLLH